MKNQNITPEQIAEFRVHLVREGKSSYTVEKYTQDVRKFQEFAGDRAVSRELANSYQKSLAAEGYTVRSVNSMMAAVNSFFLFLGREDCCIKIIKVQKQVYGYKNEEFVKAEYQRLLREAEHGSRLYMILQTLSVTGILISELSFFTVEDVQKGEVTVTSKNKTRVIQVPGGLRQMLLDYCGCQKIQTGHIFRTRNGKPVDRSNVWKEIKKLSEKTGANSAEVAEKDSFHIPDIA